MATVAEKTPYELEREARIAANKRKIEELGITESVAAVQQLADPKPAPKRKPAAPAEPADPAEIRRSGRPRTEHNYAKLSDAEHLVDRAPREPVDYEERIKGLALDSDAAERLRAELEARRANADERRAKGESKKAGPKDSGKGVRVQGGRVYDSTFGVTCHWCRQKTLEAHVTCTHPKCGKSKMPYSFCHKCLKNRHGEDAETAAASGCWVCPACRGSCGPGCVTCCNCGPCRKKALLEPTSQVVFMARNAGFSNVHDYLVHLVTGEKEEDIAARKAKAPWGAWLREDGSDASAQTYGEGEGGGEAKEEGAAGEEAAEEEDAQQQGPEPAAAAGKKPPISRKRGKSKAAGAAEAAEPEAAPATDKKGAAGAGKQRKGGGGGKKPKAASAAGADSSSSAPEAPAVAAATPRAAAGSPEDAAAPAADQDAKLSRKERMMLRMGLSPRVAA